VVITQVKSNRDLTPSRDNIDWGRVRISNQLKLLNIFLSASTVRNILQRPKPKNASPTPITCAKNHVTKKLNGCRIPAWYPNHLWSVDLTEVHYWGLWKIYVLVAIDHFSRKVVAVSPLEGPNAGMEIYALEAAFENIGKLSISFQITEVSLLVQLSGNSLIQIE
jgi:transposase InsO family protein